MVYKIILLLYVELRYFKDVFEGVRIFILWENKEVSVKKIDVMLESFLF